MQSFFGCSAARRFGQTQQVEGGSGAFFPVDRLAASLTLPLAQTPDRRVCGDEPFPWTILAGAKGVQLAEKGLESWQKCARVEVPNQPV